MALAIIAAAFVLALWLAWKGVNTLADWLERMLKL